MVLDFFPSCASCRGNSCSLVVLFWLVCFLCEKKQKYWSCHFSNFPCVAFLLPLYCNSFFPRFRVLLFERAKLFWRFFCFSPFNRSFNFFSSKDWLSSAFVNSGWLCLSFFFACSAYCLSCFCAKFAQLFPSICKHLLSV